MSVALRKYVEAAQEDNLRKVRKGSFSIEFASDMGAFDIFYTTFFVPFILRRFGDGAVIPSRGRMRHLFSRGGRILWLMQGDRRVAAVMTQSVRNVLHGHLFGHEDGGSDEQSRAGVSAALYYYLIRWASDCGYSVVDLGLSRPLRLDGVLWSKRRWGASVSLPLHDRYNYVLAWRSCNAAIRRLLHTEPLIVREGDDVSVVTALPEDYDNSAVAIHRLARRFWMPGLKRLIVIADQQFSNLEPRSLVTEAHRFWTVRPGSPRACLANAVPFAPNQQSFGDERQVTDVSPTEAQSRG